MKSDITVLVFGGRRPPRALSSLPVVLISQSGDIDAAISGRRRVVVVGGAADLAAVLSRLLRTDQLDIEVAHVGNRWSARRAITGPARRVPLIRDDTGTVLVDRALWLPPKGAAALHGEAVVDDTVLFDGEVRGVRIEPTATMPGLRARLLGGKRRRWVPGRAAQLGTTGVQVVRDGVAGTRELKRSTFYRHTTGWLRVDC